MRARALAVVVLVLATFGVATPAPRASAAVPGNAVAHYHRISGFSTPMSAVGNVYRFTVLDPSVPPSATGLVVTIETNFAPRDAVLYAHECGTEPDRERDGVHVARQTGPTGAGRFAYAIVPLFAGSVCFTADAEIPIFDLGAYAYIDSGPGGLVYQDGTDAVLVDRAFAVGDAVPVSGLPTSGYAALWLTLDASDGQGTSVMQFGSCAAGQFGAIATLTIVPGGQHVAATAPLVPMVADPCLFAPSGGFTSFRLELAGTYAENGTPSPLGPPQIHYRRTHAPGFTAVDPVRVLDTRDGGVPVNGGDAHRLALAARLPVGTEAVALNVTVTEPVGSGYVTVYPCESELPLASNLNYTAGLTVPNAVTVAVDSAGAVCLYTSATAHLIVDLSGWYAADSGDGFEAVALTRVFDTRDKGLRLAAGSVWEADLSALVPADATAAVMNVTVTDPLFAGFVTVYPCGGTVPTVSNLNFGARVTAANLATVRLPADKRVCFYTQVPAHLIADIAAVYRTSSDVGLVAITPTRLFDTRTDNASRPGARSTYFVQMKQDVTAWLLNTTVTDAAAAGYLTVWDCGLPMPTASNVNYVAGQTVPNLVVGTPVAGVGYLCFYTHQAAHYVADVSGYFTTQTFVVGYLPDGSDRG